MKPVADLQLKYFVGVFALDNRQKKHEKSLSSKEWYDRVNSSSLYYI